MTQPQSSPPNARRPWYYQTWFLVAAFILGWPIGPPFVLWPVWAVLIIRSPWHTGMLFRAPAWAMLLAGGGMLVRMFQSAGTAQVALIIMIPGMLLAVMTQMQWAKDRMEAGAGSQPSTSLVDPVERPSAASRRPRPRRRVHRRRGSRPGRSSRHLD